jgi:hypothetical protein
MDGDLAHESEVRGLLGLTLEPVGIVQREVGGVDRWQVGRSRTGGYHSALLVRLHPAAAA